MHTCIQVRTCTYIRTGTDIHWYNNNTRRETYTGIHTCTYIQINMNIHVYTRIHMHMRMHTHIQHTHTDTHTNMCAHIHAQNRRQYAQKAPHNTQTVMWTKGTPRRRQNNTKRRENSNKQPGKRKIKSQTQNWTRINCTKDQKNATVTKCSKHKKSKWCWCRQKAPATETE